MDRAGREPPSWEGPPPPQMKSAWSTAHPPRKFRPMWLRAKATSRFLAPPEQHQRPRRRPPIWRARTQESDNLTGARPPGPLITQAPRFRASPQPPPRHHPLAAQKYSLDQAEKTKTRGACGVGGSRAEIARRQRRPPQARKGRPGRRRGRRRRGSRGSAAERGRGEGRWSDLWGRLVIFGGVGASASLRTRWWSRTGGGGGGLVWPVARVRVAASLRPALRVS